MNKTERIFRIEQIIAARGVVSFAALQSELEVSRATLKRDLEYLRSRMKTPIVFDRDAGGYRIEPGGGDSRVEFPGLWFNASEAAALLTLHHLLSELQPGLLKTQVDPMRQRLEALLEQGDHDFAEVQRRVRLLHVGRRAPEPKCFSTVAAALLQRRRLRIRYFARGTGDTSERDVSPQRLVSYRQSWYLDAWCHWRNGLRSFAVDAIQQADLIDERAQEVEEAALDAEFGASYGIFSGQSTAQARLRFTPTSARWVANEVWHPQQTSTTEPDGSYVLEFPYGDDRELIGDILRHGAEVEVLAPDALRRKVAAAHAAAAARYA